ncbi:MULTISPECIES: NB-ARC domain-containing protein [Bradyrhizobium]|uniref:NB-ARC domain-containing protein n=1 Tax=Bradyrhizobium TaxID=374 RepID=UPI00155F3375|nr:MULTISPECIES: NB-ARC domain-containing protein [Bradyrhizobium]MDD1517933.1 hypothetical protein [Bradyrhizobium sp. WBAH30]MDD1540720.1 hypothetical protein [Bradyrhizobium sp. WBAH41]MDD1555834.1 hypothetical protein [Bradyrhizobium sp. WBAH23]MDD1563355.1 hypothetical protein [Bradyrhizobium sp. WBAH33]MDD1588142.1 hypothetical protein [Bradyrhizobium sp. WBAH42]
MEALRNLDGGWRAAVVRLFAADHNDSSRFGTYLGSAFLVSETQLLTCRHVVEGQSGELYASGPAWTGRQKIVNILRSADRDVALLEVADDLDRLVAPLFCRSNRDVIDNRVEVTIAGYPSAVGPLEFPRMKLRSYEGMLNTWVLHTHISKGLSGGPAIVDGEVVGIAQARETDGGKSYVIPLNAVSDLLSQRLKSGERGKFSGTNQAPSAPAEFIGRTEIQRELRQSLFEEANRVVCLKGLGGVGKTSLAQTLAWDSEVRSRFPDGVLWTTLGQSPDVLSCLHEILMPLERTTSQYASIALASAQLRILLSKARFLLVLDDVWAFEDVRPFLVAGLNCRIVITTRDKYVGVAASARIFDVGVLSLDEAQALLRARLSSDAAAAMNGEQTETLAQLVEGLPLALEIISVHLTDGISAHLLINELRTEIGRLRALTIDAAYDGNRKLSLEATLTLSFAALQPQSRRALLLLGLLRSQGLITPGVTSILTGDTLFDATKLLSFLAAKSLLMAAQTEAGERVYRMHDLIRDKCRLELLDGASRGDQQNPFRGNAQTFVASQIKQRKGQEPWSRLGKDSYLSRHLVFHLIESGDLPSVFDLLEEDEFSSDAVTVKNGWLVSQERCGWPHQFLSDVDLAWSLAESTFAKVMTDRSATLTQEAVSSLGYIIRAAFVTASVINQNARISKRLVRLLLRHGVWSPGQAVYAVGRSLDPYELVDFANELPEPYNSQALALALARLSQLFHRADASNVLSALAAALFLFDGQKKETTRRVIGELCGPTSQLPLRSLDDRELVDYAVEALVYDINVRPVVFDRVVEFLLSRLVAELEAGETSRVYIFAERYVRLLSELLFNYLWKSQTVSGIHRAVTSLGKFRSNISTVLERLADEGVASLVSLLPRERITALFDQTFAKFQAASARLDTLEVGQIGELRSSLSELARVMILCVANCDDGRLDDLVGQFARRYERFRSDIYVFLALLGKDQVVRSIRQLGPFAPMADQLQWVSSFGHEQLRRDIFSSSIVELEKGAVRANSGAILEICERHFSRMNYEEQRRLAKLLIRLPYSTAVTAVVVRIFDELEDVEAESTYLAAREVGDPIGLFVLGCARTCRGGAWDEAAVDNLTGVLRSILQKAETVRAVVDVVTFVKLPSSVSARFLEIAIESARSITDDEPVFQAFVRVASLAPNGASLVAVAPILSGVPGIVLSDEQIRACTKIKLRSLDASEPFRRATTKIENAPDEYFGSMLSDTELAAELSKKLKQLITTDSRSALYSDVVPYVRELALRGYEDVALETSYAIHDCYRWWR